MRIEQLIRLLKRLEAIVLNIAPVLEAIIEALRSRSRSRSKSRQ